MTNQREQLIQEYQRRIEALDKPKMRITKTRKRRLITGALFADLLIDPVVGLLPVIGDIGGATAIHYGFKWWFWSYDVDGSKYIDKSKTIGDAVLGFFPGIGDFLDLLFLSWLWTIYKAVNSVQEKDKKRIKQYKQKVRRLQQEMQRQLAQLAVAEQQNQQAVQGVQSQNADNQQRRNSRQPVPTNNIREDARNVAGRRYNKRSSA